MSNSFCHMELNTTDLGVAKDFYTKLFDWKLEEMLGTDYTFIKPGAGPGGGMMKHPMPGAPSMWLAYVSVDDINASTAKAKSLGATIVKDAMEVQGHGHMSILMDPTGAPIALWQVGLPGARISGDFSFSQEAEVAGGLRAHI